MATNNYLITGYWGEPHVTAENDRGINAGIFGTGRFVLPVGEQFRAEYIGNNTVRIYDGKLMNNGAAAGIPAGEFIDLLITNANQNMKRNDLIVFQYEQDTSTLVERGTFVVVQGVEASGTAVDPTLTQADLLSDKAVFDQMALWRVSVSGTTIAAPVQVFELAPNISETKKAADAAQKTADGKAAASHKHSASDVGAVPTTRKVNGKALSSDITLGAKDVGAIRVVKRTYQGNGEFGIDHPTSLTFDEAPDIVMVTDNANLSNIDKDGYYELRTQYVPNMPVDTYTKGYGFGYVYSTGSGSGDIYGRRSQDGKTLEWYCTATSSSASGQFNANGKSYTVLAVYI